MKFVVLQRSTIALTSVLGGCSLLASSGDYVQPTTHVVGGAGGGASGGAGGASTTRILLFGGTRLEPNGGTTANTDVVELDIEDARLARIQPQLGWTLGGGMATTIVGGDLRVFAQETPIAGANPSSAFARTALVDGTVTSWDWLPGPDLPTTQSAYLVSNHVFAFGGAPTPTGDESSVFTATIPATGTQLDAWKTSGKLLTGRARATALRLGSFVYVLGGHTFYANGMSTPSTPSSVVEVAPIAPDDALGAFAATASLPSPGSAIIGCATATQLIALGGGEGPQDTAAFARPGTDGAIEVWEKLPSLPSGLVDGACFVAQGRLFVAGGNRGSSIPYSSQVLSIAFGDGGALETVWRTEQVPLPAPMAQITVVEL